MVHGRDSATAVVVVNIADSGPGRRLAAHDDRDAARLEALREWVITVQRKHDHASDVATGEIALRTVFLLWRLRHNQY
jgi:hypothetical protein